MYTDSYCFSLHMGLARDPKILVSVIVVRCVALWQCLLVRIRRENNTVPLDLISLSMISYFFFFFLFYREVPVAKVGKMKYAGERFADLLTLKELGFGGKDE